MSANDDLPWIAPLLELLRNAVRRDVPVIGHCLGGQLMSRAFGGAVRLNPVREIGWGEVRVADNGVAREWLGELQAFETFQWHGETFSIPPGATRVLEGEHCPNQAFALGRHFAMQCHVEMTPELVRTWVSTGGEEMRAHRRARRCSRPPRSKRTSSRAWTGCTRSRIASTIAGAKVSVAEVDVLKRQIGNRFPTS